MPPCTLERRDVETAGAGQTVFTYTFEIFDELDITVWQEVPPAVPVELTLTVDYTVQGVDGGAKTITLVVPAALNDIITMEGHDATHARETTFSLAGPLRSADLNKEFDNLLFLSQELARDRCRTIRFPGSQDPTGISLTLPAPEASRTLGWNAGATAIINLKDPMFDSIQVAVGTAAIPSLRDVAGDSGIHFGALGGEVFIATNTVTRATFADALITLIPNVQIDGNLNVTGTITGIFTVTGLSLADDEFIEFGTGDDFLLGYVAASNILALQDGPSPGTNRFVFTPAGLASFGPTPVVTPLDVLHLINTAVDSDVLTRYVNDVQAWRTGVLGSAADAYVIRDETNTATALSIAPSTLAATFSGSILAEVAVILNNNAAPGGLGIWAFDITAGGALRGLDDSPSGAPLVWLQVNHTLLPAITDVLIQAERFEHFNTSTPPDFRIHSAYAHGNINIGGIFYEGEDDGANAHNYIILRTTVLDDTDGSEAADFTIEAGAITVVAIDTRAGVNALVMNATEYVLNEAGVDRNIRFESLTRPNCLLIDAGLDTVSIDGDFALGVSGVNTTWNNFVTPGNGIEPANTSPCAAPALTVFSGNRREWMICAFDQTVTERAIANFLLPDDYDGRALRFTIYWSATAGVAAQTVAWAFAAFADANGDDLTPADAGTNSQTDILLATSALHTIAETYMPPGGADLAGQILSVIMFRNAGSDTLAADALLMGVRVSY